MQHLRRRVEKKGMCHVIWSENKLLSKQELICHLMGSVHLCGDCWTNPPEDAEGGDVETSIGREEGAGPEDLRQKPF